MNWTNYIETNPEICHGKACVKGTRIMVSVILDNLATGNTVEDILESYPSLTASAIYATIRYASHLSQDRVISLAS